MNTRQPDASDVSDEEWTFAVPYLALLAPDSGQRERGLREVFTALAGAHRGLLVDGAT